MVVKEYNNARRYLGEHEAGLLEQEAVSQLVLSRAYQNLDIINNNKVMFGVVVEGDIPILHFCNLESNNISLYMEQNQKELAESAAALLADYITENKIQLSGLLGRQEMCQAFTTQYKKGGNGVFLEKQGMDIMEIRNLNEINLTEGKHRLAAAEEAKLITEWMVNFQIESLASEVNYEDALEKAIRLIDEGRIHVFEDMEQKPVSMAIAYRPLAHGMGVDYIYTPEEHRGKAFAAANLHGMSKELLERGNEFCTLLADKNNLLTSRTYEKVGYYVLEDLYEYQFVIN